MKAFGAIIVIGLLYVGFLIGWVISKPLDRMLHPNPSIKYLFPLSKGTYYIENDGGTNSGVPFEYCDWNSINTHFQNQDKNTYQTDSCVVEVYE